jgi:hypothetical protein
MLFGVVPHMGERNTLIFVQCLSGHLYVVPNHVLPIDEYFDLQVIHENQSEGCNGNVSFKMAQRCILRKPEQELAFFEINHMPGRRNISGLLPNKGFTIDAPGRMVIREANGTVGYISTKRTHFMENTYIDQFNNYLDVCPSDVERDTIKGECGSPVLVQQPNACVLAGIHILGGTRLQAVAVPIYKEDYEDALEYFQTPIVENDIPFLEGQNFTTDISQRCTARFIPNGTLQVFGSFGGFKRQPKSTACDTLLTSFLVEDDHKREYAPAPMRGFTAVHIGLKSMVQKQMNASKSESRPENVTIPSALRRRQATIYAGRPISAPAVAKPQHSGSWRTPTRRVRVPKAIPSTYDVEVPNHS